jgi:dTDP-4-dehydrorhamnose reductase
MSQFNPQRVIVLGPNGMLGQMVSTYFGRQGYTVVRVTERYTPENRLAFMSALNAAGSGVVVNCIGKIKQKTDNAQDLVWANGVLPLDLWENLRQDQFLVHPSTDCVFAGTAGEPYPATAVADATDDYGWSKRMGEVALLGKPRVLTIRVSIIGPDRNPSAKGLLGWFLGLPPGSQVKGFTNHLWNGVTTLEWCKYLGQLLGAGLLAAREGELVQLGTTAYYTKHEMLRLFQQTYSTNHQIAPSDGQTAVDRRLVPTVAAKPLALQMNELYEFWQ